MKTAILLLTITAALLAGCATPAGRHDARVDRRYDHVENTADRIDSRHANRYDRRGDRYDRVNTRYGY